MKFTTGTIILVSKSSYSDRTIIGDHFRVLKDFDSAEMISEFIKSANYHKVNGRYLHLPEPLPPGEEISDHFFNWLTHAGMIEKMDGKSAVEWHVGEDQQLSDCGPEK